MSSKVHCDRGHIMKREGDMWRCKKILKDGKKCNLTKAWGYVTRL